MCPKHNAPGYQVASFSPLRQQQIDWLELMRRRSTIHALLEFDVTQSRAALRSTAGAAGTPLSFTTHIVWCVARAVDADKRLQACRGGRSRLIVFDDVDVTVLIERDVEGAKIPLPYIVRAANRKTAGEIQQEIRHARAEPVAGRHKQRWLSTWLLLPAWLRRLVLQAVLANPHRRKRMMGTVAVSAVGMFGRGPAWGLPLTLFPVCVTVGGIERRQVGSGAGSTIQVQELLSLTASFDHALTDGAPAARFCQRLRELVEGAAIS
jgi:pyruvate/2-oxoglutarate dehydrogenase complex dihydrolipoamide acyltransferase (E2) component